MRRSELNDSEGCDLSNSGNYETYDGDEHESDESREYASCDGEEFDSEERADYGLEDEPSKHVRVHPLSRGSLPVELWLSILKIEDDGRALQAAGCTCKALRDIVRKIVQKRRYIGRYNRNGSIASMGIDIRHGELAFLADAYFWSRFRAGSGTASSDEMRTLTAHTHFSSFSDFARLVCALPNLVILWLIRVTVDDRGSTLQGAYFARDLRLKELWISQCAFGESQPVWNLLTAPSLSDSLEHIVVSSLASDPQRALQELSVPPAALFFANLAQLTTLHLYGWYLSCGDIRNTVCRNALSRSSAGHITAMEIDYYCDHFPPHLSEWGSLFSALDDTVTAGDLSSLTTISVSLRATHAFDVDYVRTLVGSQSHSSTWMATFTMSNVVFEPESIDETHSIRGEGPEKTEVATEERTQGIAASLCIVLGDSCGSYKVTVRYTRRQSP
ncbi:hypothetical protein CERSUDRAFT_89786 [Gelatoporia subvermispora B]|uniref:F-box domain-containing protein n=1 Tax=Ceriporiopsis subvermispora (strain B) TaxID=914234 RepID=M2QVR4_CERS8|nr:hypothetical protein CERSUDRAFT_89786 [Gelatoporia subvermispora B]